MLASEAHSLNALSAPEVCFFVCIGELVKGDACSLSAANRWKVVQG